MNPIHKQLGFISINHYCLVHKGPISNVGAKVHRINYPYK